MKVVGISMMKDESDICYWTVKHMLTQVDEVVVLDNNSSDNTAALCQAAGATVIPDPDPAYYQSRKMTDLAHKVAEEDGNIWIVPFDADEIWYSGFGTVSEILNQASDSYVVKARLYNHIPTAIDPDDINPISRLGWRTNKPGALPKVACRYHKGLVIEQGNHGAKYNTIVRTSTSVQLVIRHFPYRSPEHFVRKVRNGYAAYQATDLGESSGAHWRGYGRILEDQGEDALVNNVFKKWFYSPDPGSNKKLIFDPAPVNF